MATEQEVYKFVLQFENEEKLKTVAAAASLAEQKFKALYSSVGAGAPQVKAAAASMVDLNRQLKDAQSSFGNASNKMQVFAQGLDDLQYVPEQGLRPILNNLVQISPVAGAVAIVGQAIYDHWSKIAGLFGSSTTKTQADAMKELADKTSKTADETLRLLNYERQRNSLAAQNKAPKAQEKITDDINDAIREAPVDKVLGAVNTIFGDRIKKAVPQEIKNDLERYGKAVAEGEANLANLRKNPNLNAPSIKAAEGNLRDDEKALNDAKDRYNTAYGEARSKIQAGLATDLDKNGRPEKFEKFIDEAEKRKLLNADQISKLRNAIPDVRAQNQIDNKDKELQAGNRKKSAEAIFKAREELEKNPERFSAGDIKAFDALVKPPEGQGPLTAENVGKKFEQFKKDHAQDLAKFTPGFQQQLSPEILNNVARGRQNDPAALAAKISDQLQDSGQTKEKADSLADTIGKTILKNVEGRVIERSNQQNVSKEEGAARELEDDTAAARSRAPRPKGAITDASGFAHSLQMALFNKADPIQQAILDVNRKAADNLEKLVEETRKQKPRQSTAVAAGPA